MNPRGWGSLALKLTQEEVFMLVVVGQVFQLLLAILRRGERGERVNMSLRTPALFTTLLSRDLIPLPPVCIWAQQS